MGNSRQALISQPEQLGEQHSPPRTLSGFDYFEALSRLEGRRFSSLDSARVLLTALDNPQDKVASVHVAGTNGKGTVSALIAAMLLADGKSVGQTCSPHLTDVCERCLVNGAPHSEAEFCHAIERVVEASFAADICPSYFVLGLAACFYEFARLGLERMVIEVGLGGKLDATNLMRAPLASVITNISFDHVDLLGSTLGEIAEQKAGILKPGVPAFVGAVSPSARLAIEREAKRIGTHVEFFGNEFCFDESTGEILSTSGAFKIDLEALSLRGAHQRRNAILAARVAQHLGISESTVNEGLRRVRWPGRLELFQQKNRGATNDPHDVLLDVAHNPGGIEAMIEALPAILLRNGYQRLVFVLSALDRKDWRTMFASLADASQNFQEKLGIEVSWMFTTSGHTHAVAPEELAQCFSRGRGFPGGRVIESPEEALAAARELAGPKTLVFVTGSLFLVGRLRPAITSEPFRSFV